LVIISAGQDGVATGEAGKAETKEQEPKEKEEGANSRSRKRGGSRKEKLQQQQDGSEQATASGISPGNAFSQPLQLSDSQTPG